MYLVKLPRYIGSFFLIITHSELVSKFSSGRIFLFHYLIIQINFFISQKRCMNAIHYFSVKVATEVCNKVEKKENSTDVSTMCEYYKSRRKF